MRSVSVEREKKNERKVFFSPNHQQMSVVLRHGSLFSLKVARSKEFLRGIVWNVFMEEKGEKGEKEIPRLWVVNMFIKLRVRARFT